MSSTTEAIPRAIRQVDARAQLLAWTILAFQRPRAEGLRTLIDNDPRALLRAAGFVEAATSLDLRWTSAPATALLDHLEEEYVRLFVASRTTPVAHPEALAYFTDRDGGRTDFLVDLASELSRIGLRPDPSRGLPPDHLTLLLELLYARGGDRHPQEEDPFRSRFLRSWVPRFLNRLAGAEPQPFYQDAARILSAVLGVDDPFRLRGGTQLDDPGHAEG